MLKNYLTSTPFTKFIIIEDSLEERGKPLFDFLFKFHLDKTSNISPKIHYFVFQDNFKRVQTRIQINSNLILHDCNSNILNWNIDSSTRIKKSTSFQEIIEKLNSSDIVFIDSLAHVIFQYGLPDTYKFFNSLRHTKCVQQIITVLHLDLLEKDNQTDKLFEHLSTFKIWWQPSLNANSKRIHYVYKKVGGKVIKEVEEYHFEDGNLVTQKVEKLDPIKLFEKLTVEEVNPETLSTFKIGLNEREKESRDQLVLPYLPKLDDSSEGGDIIYQLDEHDDWDEEDPDDDLDI